MASPFEAAVSRDGRDDTAQFAAESTKTVLAERSEFLRTLVDKQPDATLEELRTELQVAVSWRALDELKLSFKKE